MTGWFEIAKHDKGRFSFVLKAANSQVVLRSQHYEWKGGALGGVASVQFVQPLRRPRTARRAAAENSSLTGGSK